MTKNITGIEQSDVLEGEDQTSSVSVGCQLSQSIYKGILTITNYQLIFIPEDALLTRRRRLRPDFFKIPLGLISSYFYITAKFVGLIKILKSDQ